MEERDFESAIEYIKEFLTYYDQSLAKRIYYLAEDEIKFHNLEKSIIVIKSGFFNKGTYGEATSVPEGCFDYQTAKMIFGRDKSYKLGTNIVIEADIIASAYFLLTRYEEFVTRENRDEFGNYPAKESFLVKNNLLERPIVDEYSKIIMKEFSDIDSVKYDIKKGFNSVTYTHDIDAPFKRYKNFSIMAKSIIKPLLKKHVIDVSPLLNWLGIYSVNPQSTWKYMLKKESEVKNNLGDKIKSICFIIAINKKDPQTMDYIEDKKTRPILQEMENLGAELGVHTSYDGAANESEVAEEKHRLECKIGHEVSSQRNHYLRQLKPEDMEWYFNAGFTDDYTTGFNERPGFRLGTSRVFKWINPKNGKVYPINIHTLNIMDGSLDGSKPYQLELNYDEAESLCKRIIDEVYKHNGDLCLLWHNGIFKRYNYQKKLYDWIVKYCIELERNKNETN